MKTITISEAEKKLNKLVESVNKHQQEILIQGKHSNAVLIPQENWFALQETLHLVSIPNMKQSILDGMRESPISLGADGEAYYDVRKNCNLKS